MVRRRLSSIVADEGDYYCQPHNLTPTAVANWLAWPISMVFQLDDCSHGVIYSA